MGYWGPCAVGTVLASLLVVSSFCISEGSLDDAFLLVHKKAVTKKVSSGEDILVLFSIFNVGVSTAYDVALNDDTWPSDIFDVDGNVTTTWDSIEPGAKLEHSFHVKPKAKGPYVAPPAVVKFRITTKTDLQTAYSTPLGELDILSDKPQESQLLWIKDLAIKFGPFLACVCLVIVLVLVFTKPTKPRKTKSGKRKQH